jgi:hypothetical protein
MKREQGSLLATWVPIHTVYVAEAWIRLEAVDRETRKRQPSTRSNYEITMTLSSLRSEGGRRCFLGRTGVMVD